MAFAIGHISGCHLNPAVTFGLYVGGRHPGGEILPYWVAQVLGGIVAAGLLAGLLRPRIDPRARIDSTIRHPAA